MSETSARAVPLVEDNPADISLIRKAIEACDPQIHLSIVPNGRDVLAFLQEGVFALEPSPALVLLDLNLPYLYLHGPRPNGPAPDVRLLGHAGGDFQRRPYRASGAGVFAVGGET